MKSSCLNVDKEINLLLRENIRNRNYTEMSKLSSYNISNDSFFIIRVNIRSLQKILILCMKHI